MSISPMSFQTNQYSANRRNVAFSGIFSTDALSEEGEDSITRRIACEVFGSHNDKAIVCTSEENKSVFALLERLKIPFTYHPEDITKLSDPEKWARLAEIWRRK